MRTMGVPQEHGAHLRYINHELNAAVPAAMLSVLAAFGAALVLYGRWFPFVLVFSAGSLVSQGAST